MSGYVARRFSMRSHALDNSFQSATNRDDCTERTVEEHRLALLLMALGYNPASLFYLACPQPGGHRNERFSEIRASSRAVP